MHCAHPPVHTRMRIATGFASAALEMHASTPESGASRCVRITLRRAPSAVAVVLMQRAALGAFAPMAIVQGPAMALLAAVTRCANVLYSSSALSHMDAARLSALNIALL